MFWRSVGSSQNAFAVESFIDEVAHAAKRDPLAYRRGLLEGRPDFLAVLDALADKGDWGKPTRKGVGRGVAIHEAFGTIVGEIAEVAVSDRGEVKVERVVACVDCGHLVNPLTAAMQIESAVLYGLTAALFGEITIKEGRVEQGNFDTYPIARMADAPVIETHFVLSGGEKWGGLGEPGTPADRAGGRQRDLRRHGQAHPLAAAEERGAGGVSERRARNDSKPSHPRPLSARDKSSASRPQIPALSAMRMRSMALRAPSFCLSWVQLLATVL